MSLFVVGKLWNCPKKIHHGVIFLQVQFSTFHSCSENDVAANENDDFSPDKICSGVEISVKNCGT